MSEFTWKTDKRLPYLHFNSLCRSNSFPSNQKIQHGMFLNIINCLFVSNHCKVVSIALKYFVVHFHPSSIRGGIRDDLSDINTVVSVSIRGSSVILVNPSTNFESTSENLSPLGISPWFLLQSYRNLNR